MIENTDPECDFKFDLSQVYTSLLDYINCEDSGYRHQRGFKYGFDCEREFANYIKAQKGYYLDERYSRLFMELKELMVRRLEYLASEQIVSPEILPEYKPMCEQQKAIHMMFIKYNLTHNECFSFGTVQAGFHLFVLSDQYVQQKLEGAE